MSLATSVDDEFMSIVMCPSCRKNCAADAPRCGACGWNLQGDRDKAYNRSVVFWGRILTALCATAIYLAIRSMGRRPLTADYRDMVLFQAIPAIVIWGTLKMLYPRSGRNMWMTALLPSMVIATGVFVARALRGAMPLGNGLDNALVVFAGPTTKQAAAEAAARASAAFEPLRPLARDCFTFIGKQPSAIVSEFDSAGIARLLSPREMEDAKRLDASRARIKRVHARLNDYEARIRKSAADVTTKVQTSNSPAEVKADFILAVRECGGDFVRQTLAFIALQRRTLDKGDELLALAQSRVGGYRVEGGNRLVFAAAADQQKCDALRRELDELTVQRDAAVRRLRTQAQDAVVALEAAPNTSAQASVAPEQR